MKNVVLAYLLGVLSVLAVERWVYAEYTLWNHEVRISYIEGFLQQVMR